MGESTRERITRLVSEQKRLEREIRLAEQRREADNRRMEALWRHLDDKLSRVAGRIEQNAALQPDVASALNAAFEAVSSMRPKKRGRPPR